MSTIDSSRGSLPTSSGVMRSRSITLVLVVERFAPPRVEHLHGLLADHLGDHLLVSVDLPPRNTTVSQQSRMVFAPSFL